MKISTSLFTAIFISAFVVPLQVFAAQDASLGNAYPNVCVGASIEREEIGGTRFPVAPKYKHLNWLGQLFTADDCGAARLAEFYTGEDASYDIGSTIWLKNKPNQHLRRLLKAIGYSCKEGDEKSCTYWSTGWGSGEVNKTSVYKLLLLKAYKSKIKQDDCLNCG